MHYSGLGDYMRFCNLLVYLVFLISLNALVNAYSVDGENCTCQNCTDCTDALNDNLCRIVEVNDTLVSRGTQYCIDAPVNFTSKVIDCQANIMNLSVRHGIQIKNNPNVTIRNCVIIGNSRNGIMSHYTDNVTISNVNITGAATGIDIWDSHNAVVEDCNIDDGGQGIRIYISMNTTIKNTHLANNSYDLSIAGNPIEHYLQNIDTSNTVGGKPVYFVIGQENLVFDGIVMDIGYLGLISCHDVSIKNLEMNNNREGVLLVNTSRINITDSAFIDNYNAIVEKLSHDNRIERCVTENSWYGIYVTDHSKNITIKNINATDSVQIDYYSDTVLLEHSNVSIVTLSYAGNVTLRNFTAGEIDASYSDNLAIEHCNVTRNGIYIRSSSNALIRDCNASGGQNRILFGLVYDSLIENCQSINGRGIGVSGNNNTLLNNTVMYPATRIDRAGFSISGTGHTLRHNKASGCTRNFVINPSFPDGYFTLDIDTTNTIEGKPTYYWINEHDRQVPVDAGFFVCVNCTNITVADLDLKYNHAGVLLVLSNDSIVYNVTAIDIQQGIYLRDSHHNEITGCNATCILETNYDSQATGIHLDQQSSYNEVNNNWVERAKTGINVDSYNNNNIIRANTLISSSTNLQIALNSENNVLLENYIVGGNPGIYVLGEHTHIENNTLYDGGIRARSEGNFIIGNRLLDSVIKLESSHYNLISRNEAYNGSRGFYLDDSDYNNLTNNIAKGNEREGLELHHSHHNRIYGNEFCANNHSEYVDYDISDNGFNNTGDNNKCEFALAWNDTGAVGCSAVCCYDLDLDGFKGATINCSVGSDCDDHDASSNPNGTEICDGADNDCNGTRDMPGCVMMEMVVPAGWNLLSVPLAPDNTSPEFVFGDTNYSSLLAYDDGWSIPTAINPAKGLWMKLDKTQNMSVWGFHTVNLTLNLESGWNLVGYPGPEKNISYFNESNITHVFAYNNNTWRSYSIYGALGTLHILSPWQGYWLYAAGPVNLSIG